MSSLGYVPTSNLSHTPDTHTQFQWVHLCSTDRDDYVLKTDRLPSQCYREKIFSEPCSNYFHIFKVQCTILKLRALTSSGKTSTHSPAWLQNKSLNKIVNMGEVFLILPQRLGPDVGWLDLPQSVSRSSQRCWVQVSVQTSQNLSQQTRETIFY